MWKSIFIVFICSLFAVQAQDCMWDYDSDYPVDRPLIIDLATWISIQPAMEGAQRIVRMTAGQTAVFACPGFLIGTLGVEFSEGTCIGGVNLDFGGQTFTMSDLGCTNSFMDSFPNLNLGPCGDGNIGELHDLGFDLTGYPFYTTMTVCFESIEERSLWVTSTIRGANIAASDSTSPRPSFQQDPGLFTVDVNNCYLTANQDAYFTQLTGDPDYIDLDLNNYFSRGHMAAAADFTTKIEVDSTFHYTNAMPQWQQYNGGNWVNLENAVRDVASAHLSDLTVHTGNWDIVKVQDVNTNLVSIYLGVTEGKNVIPAPEVTWKVIYEASTDRAAAFVGANTPYMTSPMIPLCSDVCSQLTWVDWNLNDLQRGHMYCCTVQDLRAAIPHVPDYPTATLLTN